MWHNPRLLNAAAGFLVGLAALAFGVAGIQLVLSSGLFPLREIVLTNEPQKTRKHEIEAAVGGLDSGNFFALELDGLRSSLEQLPWVRRVSVRRVWPDRLEVAVEEHVALARWGDDTLINTHGEPFAGRSNAALPVFVAPAGTEAEVTRRYARFADAIAPLGTELERVVLTPRLAWQLRLANGVHLMLGRDAEAAEQRLRRFVAVHETALKNMPRRHEYVDLRYPNGFALRLPELRG